MKKIKYETNQNHPQIKSYKKAVKQGSKSQHVLPKEGSWIVKRAGADKATKVFGKQQEATDFASDIAKRNKTSLFIHRKNGRIRDRIDYQ